MNEMIESYLGLTANQIAFWAMIGTWLSSIGTIAATITAIIISLNSSKLKLKVECKLGHLPNPINGYFEYDDKYLIVEAINTCDRTVTIEQIYTRLPSGKSIIFFYPFNKLSTKLPCKLEHSDRASFFCSIGKDTTHLHQLFREMDVKDQNFKKWKIEVSLSTGKVFTKRLPAKVINEFEKILNG